MPHNFIKHSELESRAIEFATHQHRNHFRKYTDEPYIIHPASVVQIVRQVPHTEAMICAAWLHDTVEDTNATLEQIKRMFGEEVMTLVEMLTDSDWEDGDRAEHKRRHRDHSAKANADAQTIKLADSLHNMPSIIYHDPKFAETYIREKAELLSVLHLGHPTLWRKCYRVIEKYSPDIAATIRHPAVLGNTEKTLPVTPKNKSDSSENLIPMEFS